MRHGFTGFGVGFLIVGACTGIIYGVFAAPPENRSEHALSAPVNEEALSAAEILAQPTPLENAIEVAFSRDADRSPQEEEQWREAVDYLRTAITSRGYRCVVPYEFAQVDSAHYGIGCVNNRELTRQTNFLVNVRTGDVEPI
jgi:hypothetical protein